MEIQKKEQKKDEAATNVPGGKRKWLWERTEGRAIRTHQYGREIKKKLQRKLCVQERASESEVNVETRRTGEMNRVKWCGTHTHTPVVEWEKDAREKGKVDNNSTE